MTNAIVDERGEVVIPEPPLAHSLFSTTRFAWLWFVIRLYVGSSRLSSGWGKLTGGVWATGDPLRGF